jgi:hypothetical protein
MSDPASDSGAGPSPSSSANDANLAIASIVLGVAPGAPGTYTLNDKGAPALTAAGVAAEGVSQIVAYRV